MQKTMLFRFQNRRRNPTVGLRRHRRRRRRNQFEIGTASFFFHLFLFLMIVGVHLGCLQSISLMICSCNLNDIRTKSTKLHKNTRFFTYPLDVSTGAGEPNLGFPRLARRKYAAASKTPNVVFLKIC